MDTTRMDDFRLVYDGGIMKYYIIALMILFVIPSTVSALEEDKVLHAIGTYGITHATQAICNRATQGEHKTGCLITGIVVASSIAAGKELLDQHRGTNTVRQSLDDGIADVAGIGAAVLMIKIDF